MTNRWFADNEQGQMRMSAVAMASSFPCYAVFLAVPQKYLALMILIPLTIALNFFVASTYALMQRLVPDVMRATSMAVLMLLYNLIGMGIAPQVVGLLSDLLMPVFGRDSLRYAMLTVTCVGLWSAYHFWQVGRTVKEDLSAVTGRCQLTSIRPALREEF